MMNFPGHSLLNSVLEEREGIYKAKIRLSKDWGRNIFLEHEHLSATDSTKILVNF